MTTLHEDGYVVVDPPQAIEIGFREEVDDRVGLSRIQRCSCASLQSSRAAFAPRLNDLGRDLHLLA